MRGIVYKNIGGFYYVKTADALVECKPRGIFRKDKIKIVTGDEVMLGEEAGTPFIDELLPRKNSFVRPPISNVDRFFLIASTVEPAPSFGVLDRLSAVAFEQEAQPVVVVTKPDLGDAAPLVKAYQTSGIPLHIANALTGEGIEEIRGLLQGGLNVFCGNSGVGKSTLLNALLPGLGQETGDISQKLGRGRHTTREVELFEVAGGLVADTPGFASYDVQAHGAIPSENLQYDFPEISALVGRCKYRGCSHTAEDGCAVRATMEAGEIAESRYKSYCELYEQARQAEQQY